MFPWQKLSCERYRAFTNVQNMYLVLKWAEQELKASARRELHQARLRTKGEIALLVRNTEQLEEAVLVEVIIRRGPSQPPFHAWMLGEILVGDGASAPCVVQIGPPSQVIAKRKYDSPLQGFTSANGACIRRCPASCSASRRPL